jgi:hypothetical protein
MAIKQGHKVTGRNRAPRKGVIVAQLQRVPVRQMHRTSAGPASTNLMSCTQARHQGAASMATPAERAALRDRIASILLSDPCQRICFTIAEFAVTPGAYTVIGMSLDNGGAPPVYGRSPMRVQVAQPGPSRSAEYDADTNTIVVPRADYGQTPRQRMSLVHECTHAIFDFNRVNVDAWTEEAAAFIAGAIFLRMTGQPLIGGGAFGVAETIAADLVPPAGAIRLAPWSRTVTQQQLDTLVTAIRAMPAYADLRGKPRGYRYFHDGGTL